MEQKILWQHADSVAHGEKRAGTRIAGELVFCAAAAANESLDVVEILASHVQRFFHTRHVGI